MSRLNGLPGYDDWLTRGYEDPEMEKLADETTLDDLPEYIREKYEVWRKRGNDVEAWELALIEYRDHLDEIAPESAATQRNEHCEPRRPMPLCAERKGNHCAKH